MASDCGQSTFTVKQISERWQCKPHSVLSAIHAGRLKAFKLVPSAIRPTWRITANSLSEFEDQQGTPQVKAEPKPRQPANPEFVEFF